MTWVFGNPTILGSAICVADIQVTVGSETFDCLRKLYALDDNVVAGFAGDVMAGFAMLEVLADSVAEAKQDQAPADIRGVIETFSASAPTAYRRLPTANQRSGCALLVAGASPSSGTLYGSKSEAARLRAPDFRPDYIPRGEWQSIGSGSDVAAYREELEGVTGPGSEGLMQMESNMPGGYAHAMSIAIVQSVAEMASVPGISKHFHTAIVFAHGGTWGTSDRTVFPGVGTPERIEMPHVANSWSELQMMLAERLGTAPTIAVA